MDISNIEQVAQLAVDYSTAENVAIAQMFIGKIFGESAMTLVGGIFGGIGITWSVVSAAASEYCARTKTRDTKFYKVMEFFARNNDTAKEKA